MLRIKKEPGMIFDTLSLLVFKLNDSSVYLPVLTNAGTETDDYSYIQFWKSKIENPPSNLLVFFYKQDVHHSYFMCHLFTHYLDLYKGDLTFNQFLECMNDSLLSKLLKYYLQDEYVELDSFDIPHYVDIIRRSSYIQDAQIKMFLMDILLNQDQYIPALINTLKTTYEIVSKYYERESSVIVDFYNAIEPSMFDDILTRFYHSSIDYQKQMAIHRSCEMITISICLIMHHTTRYQVNEEQKCEWFILGSEYNKAFKALDEIEMDIDIIGNAIGDKHRAKIMHLLIENGEMSAGELCKELNLALNTGTYHLSIMREANILLARVQGKSTFYSINAKACKKISRKFAAWSMGREKISNEELVSMEQAYF